MHNTGFKREGSRRETQNSMISNDSRRTKQQKIPGFKASNPGNIHILPAASSSGGNDDLQGSHSTGREGPDSALGLKPVIVNNFTNSLNIPGNNTLNLNTNESSSSRNLPKGQPKSNYAKLNIEEPLSPIHVEDKEIITSPYESKTDVY